MIAIIAALPREVSGLVQKWDRNPQLSKEKLLVFTSSEAVVVCAGMGQVRATVAFGAALAVGSVGEVWSVGLAGGCDPGLRVGDVVRGGLVVDGGSGERYRAMGGDAVVVSGSGIASVGEKRRLWESYRAAAVDMEAATIGRLALAHGIGFRVIKAISDEAGFELEGLGRFATADGQFRTAAFALHTAIRPGTWKTTMELGRNSKRAIDSLTRVLRDEIGERSR